MKINFGKHLYLCLVFSFWNLTLRTKKNVLNNEKEGNTNLPMQSISVSQTGGEILQNEPPFELRIFSGQRYHYNGKDQPTIPVHVQSSLSRIGHVDIPSNPSLSIPSPIMSFQILMSL